MKKVNNRNNKRINIKKTKGQLTIFYMIVMLLFLCLTGRLFYITATKGDEYKKQVLSQQKYDSKTIPYQRGAIVDSKGTTLAVSKKVYNAVLDSSVVSYYEEKGENDGSYRRATAEALSSCFGIDSSTLVKYMEENPQGKYYVVAKQLDYDRVQSFNEIVEQSKENEKKLKSEKAAKEDKKDKDKKDKKKEEASEEVTEEETTSETEESSEEEIIEIEQVAENKVNAPNTSVRGVWFEEEYLRNYPNGTLAGDVIGYTNSGNSGAYGLEEFYNDILNGTNGREYGYLNDDQNLERTTIPAENGKTIVTTIDANIQKIVENKLDDFCKEYDGNYREGFACNNIGCIVMECDTGNVLGMASAPNWDPNKPRAIDEYYTPEQIETFRKELVEQKIKQLPPNVIVVDHNENGEVVETAGTNENALKTSEEVTENGETVENPEAVSVLENIPNKILPEEEALPEGMEETDNELLTSNQVEYINADELVSEADLNQYALAKLWSNFCITGTYEPGSVAKPFTVAMGLDSGKMTGHEHYNCTGSLTVGGNEIKCHNVFGDGDMDVASAIAQSCNVSLMYMGQTIGKSTYLDYFKNFNFGLKTNVDLTGEARTDSLVFNSETMGETELATSTFGQGFNVTMIQMVSAFNSLVNGGYYYEPHLVSQILSSEGSVLENIEPRILKQTVSNSTSEKIVGYCNQVVTDGTGKNARPAGYAIGGKTGTAETLPRGNHEYVVSFMGYAPADDPQILVYVVIDRPNMPDQTNGTRQAAIISREIMTEVLPYLNVFMTEELTEAEMDELERKGLYNATLYRPEPEDENEENSDVIGEEGEDVEAVDITDPSAENTDSDNNETGEAAQ